jgi:hypothetical protein
VLADLREGGYTLSVITRVEIHHHRVGPHPITLADKLWVTPTPPEALQEEIRANRDELLAAACVLASPVPWLEVLTRRYQERRAPLVMLAANVAGFMALHPARDGPRLERAIRAALR